MSANSRRLVIDARDRALGAARPLLGLNLLRRMIRAATRSGFTEIVVLARPDGIARIRALTGDEADIAIASELPPPEADMVTARVAADLVGERYWLTQLAREIPARGVRHAVGADIFLFGAGATPEQIAEANAISTVDPIVFEQPPLRMTVESDRNVAEKRLLKALVKDSDGFMSRYFARPISTRVSRHLAPLGITPNQMTIICAFIGLAAAPFFLSARPAIQAIGGLLFAIHSVLDGCDGELARLTFRESRLGGLLDFFSDNAVHVAIFACMAMGWSLAAHAAWPLLLGASAVLGTTGSASAVYWLTLRKKTAAGPVYTSVSTAPSGGLTKVLDALSRRDFIYLVFALSLFGKANWFLAVTAIGAPVFFFLVLWTASRDARRRRAAA